MPHALALLLATVLGAADRPQADPFRELLALAAHHHEARVREGAIRALTTLQWQPATSRDWSLLASCGAQALPFVERLLASPKAATRAACCAALAQIGSKAEARGAALKLIVGHAAKERDGSVVKSCAQALLKLGWPANAQESGLVFAPRPLPWPLIDALLELPSGPHIPPMIRSLSALAEKPETAAEAGKRLEVARKRIPPKEMVRQLLEDNWRPASDKDWLLLSSLGANGMPVLDRLLAEGNEALRLRALRTMVELLEGEPTARPEVFKRLCSLAFGEKAEPKVREAAAAALVELKGPATVGERELLACHGSSALPLIGRLLASGDPATRGRGVACLAQVARVDGKLRVAILDQLLTVSVGEKDAKVKGEAVRCLADLGWPADPAELAGSSKDNPKAWDILRLLVARAKAPAAGRLCGMLAAMARGNDAAGKLAFGVLASLASDPKAAEARKAAVASLKQLAGDASSPRGVEALNALIALAAKDKALAKEVSGFLAERLSAKLEPRLREVVLRGLARLRWCPADEAQERKLVETGPAALIVTEPLVQHPDLAVRQRAMDIISQIARQHEEARDVAFAQLARLAQDASDKALSKRATGLLRSMGWPRTDADWADLVKLGARAEPLLATLIADESNEVRARAAKALAQVAAGQKDPRQRAVVALLRLVLLDESQPVREAAMAGLLRLGWPASDAEWAVLEKLRSKALGPLAWLVRNAPDGLKQKAAAKARTLSPSLLADAELRVDEVSLLDGRELRWELGFEADRQKILALAQEKRLDLVGAGFRQALKKAEESEERVHDLVVALSRWPLAGVADKWKALAELLDSKALAGFRKSRHLTVGNWRATLGKRSADLERWRHAFREVASLAEPQARLDRLARFLTANPQSYYAHFAWKWKDILSRRARREK